MYGFDCTFNTDSVLNVRMICRKVRILFAMFFNLGINTAIVKHRHITTELSFSKQKALSFGAHQTLPRE
jgi:hypothetical protein